MEHAGDTPSVVSAIAKKTGMTVEKSDFVTAYKTGKPKRYGDVECQNIIVEWSNRVTASRFLAKVNEYRKQNKNRLGANVFPTGNQCQCICVPSSTERVEGAEATGEEESRSASVHVLLDHREWQTANAQDRRISSVLDSRRRRSNETQVTLMPNEAQETHSNCITQHNVN